MPRTGYDSISIDRTARGNLSALKLELSALAGRQLSTSDAIGLLVVIGHVVVDATRGDMDATPIGEWISVADGVWREQRSNARRNQSSRE
jgi:hypothetical protein